MMSAFFNRLVKEVNNNNNIYFLFKQTTYVISIFHVFCIHVYNASYMFVKEFGRDESAI